MDVQSDKDTQDKPPVIYNYVDANTERNQARLEKRRSKSPQDWMISTRPRLVANCLMASNREPVGGKGPSESFMLPCQEKA